mgnify:CR=1 FL=1
MDSPPQNSLSPEEESTGQPNPSFSIKPYLWQGGKIGPAFWTITGIISLIGNVILIAVVILLARQLTSIKTLVSDQLINGLYDDFVLMDQANIQTTVEVNSIIPVQFDLPVKTDTIVVLTQDTTISGARVSLSTGGLSIYSAPTDIILPAGTNLPIALDITVPVDTTVPVTLQVPVNIPLNQTELHKPFVGLQNVVSPYRSLLNQSSTTWQQVICGQPANGLCKWLFQSSGE